MTAKILFLPPRTPMASLIHSAVPDAALSYGLGSTPFEQPASPHYNAVCDGTFASVLGLDHQQLVDDAVAEKATTSPPLH